KTRARADRCLINLSRCASNPARVMLYDDFGFLDANALCFDLAERFVALRQLRPRRALLIDQRRHARFQAVIAFIGLISTKLFVVDYHLIPIHARSFSAARESRPFADDPYTHRSDSKSPAEAPRRSSLPNAAHNKSVRKSGRFHNAG